MPYYPAVTLDSAKPGSVKGDVALATDSYKAYFSPADNVWAEIGQADGTVTLAGTVAQGDLIGYSTGWKDADNTAGSIVAASFIALKAGVSGDVIPVSRRGLVAGSFTAGSAVYLTAAGAVTSTRPTTGASLRQKVGVALSTTSALVDLNGAREVDIPITHVLEYSGGEGALTARVALDSGLYEGYQLNAQNEYITFGVMLPENFVSVARAELFAAADVSGTRTCTITVNSVVTGNTAWDTVTADSSETGKTLATNAAGDPVNFYDFSAALDAASIARPGAFLAIQVKADDAGTDALLVFGGHLTVRVA